MALPIESFSDEFDPSFKVYHDLMAKKVRDILLVSTPYDAWIMEEDCRLSERIIHEYRGLNLSNPPRFTWVATAEEALAAIDKKNFDMVITMLHLADMDAFLLGQAIKERDPDLPVILLTHSALPSDESSRVFTQPRGIDRTFVWAGDTDILVGNNNGPARLLINHVGNRYHWLGLRLLDRAGRIAIGAKVAVTSSSTCPTPSSGW